MRESTEDQDNDNNAHSIDSDHNRDEPPEKMAWNFHDINSGDHRGVSALQFIHTLCTKYNVIEPETLVSAHSIIENEICSILRVGELADQLTEVGKTCENLEKQYKREAFWPMHISAQHTLMEQKKADTLAQASGAVVS